MTTEHISIDIDNLHLIIAYVTVLLKKMEMCSAYKSHYLLYFNLEQAAGRNKL